MEHRPCRSIDESSFDEEDRRVWISATTVSGMVDPSGSDTSLLNYWNVVSVVRRVLIIAVSTLGLGFNSFVLFAIVANRKLRGKVVHVLNCHLAAVDILWCVLLLLFEVVSDVFGGWETLCDAYALCRTLVCHVSVWTIASLSWDKYRTIASPMSHSPTADLIPVSACLGLIWITGLIAGLFPFLFCKFGEPRSKDSFHPLNATAPPGCWWYFFDHGRNSFNSTSDRSGLSWYLLFLSVDTFCLPLVLLGYCYCHIFRIARWQRKRIAVMAAMVRVITLSVGVPITHENARRTSNQVTTRGRKALRTVCTFLGAFLFCYAAYGLTSLAGSFYGVRLHPVPAALSDLMLMTSPTVNALIYGLRNRTLKQCFRNCMRRKCAQYALKFPGLHGAILRHFGPPDKAIGHFKGPCESRMRKPSYDPGPGTPDIPEEPGRGSVLRIDDLICTEIKFDSSKPKPMNCTTTNYSLYPSERFFRICTQQHPSEKHSKLDRTTNHSTNITTADLGDIRSDDRSGSTNGTSKKIVLSDDEVVEPSSGLELAWKYQLPTTTASLVMEGKNRIVVGVDVHSMLRNPTNSL